MKYPEAYSAGYTDYDPQGSPHPAAKHYTEAYRPVGHTLNDSVCIHGAYLQGWEAAAASTEPVKSYWATQLAAVNTTSNNDLHPDGATVKINGNGNGAGGPKYLSLTPSQFDRLSAFLLSIEEPKKP